MPPTPQIPERLTAKDDVHLNEEDFEKAPPLPSPPLIPSPPQSKHAEYLRYMSLLVLVFQMVSLVITVRFVKTNKNAKADALNTVVLFLSEILKLIAATLLFGFSVGSVSQTLRGLKQHLVVEWVDNLKVFVPAFIYTVQNLLLFFSLSYLDPATYMVTYQLKILTTAVFTVLILKRKLKLVQWVALLILLLGVCLVQYNVDKNKGGEASALSSNSTTSLPKSATSSVCAKREQGKDNHWFGLVAVLIAAVLSGFAGIYFEKILKGSNVSVWMRNVQLALFSIPLLFVMIGVQDYACVRQEGPLVGFTPLVWLTVLLQAFGGLVVALVIKYADNIMKAFATSVSIVVGALVATVFFSDPPKPFFFAGTPLVIGAVVLYSIPRKTLLFCRRTE